MVELGLTVPRVFSTPLIIGVIADTHIWSNGARRLPPQVLELFQRAGVELILHAGDVNDQPVLEELAAIAPVIAVRGNNDSPDLQRELAQKELLNIGEHQLGLVHGHEGRSARDVALAAFPESVDLVVYGHSHMPKLEQKGSTVYFNPGSPTDRRRSPHFGVGIIRCDGDGLHPNLVLFARSSELENIWTGGLPGSNA